MSYFVPCRYEFRCIVDVKGILFVVVESFREGNILGFLEGILVGKLLVHVLVELGKDPQNSWNLIYFFKIQQFLEDLELVVGDLLIYLHIQTLQLVVCIEISQISFEMFSKWQAFLLFQNFLGKGLFDLGETT